jgi:cell division initiation protein
MALTPNDIRNYELSTQMRGYHKEEVDDLLEAIATAMEADKQANLKLSMEVDNLKQQLTALKEHEDVIKGAAIDARRNADQAIKAAKAEAEKVLSKARAESERIMASHQQALAENKAKVERAEQIKDTYLQQLRDLIESHLGMVENVDMETPELPETPQQTSSTQVVDRTEEAPRHADDTANSDLPEMSEEEVSALDSVLPSDAGDDESEGNIEVTDSSEVDRDTMETVGSEKHKEEPEAAEEANAADKIVEVGRAPEPGEQPSGSQPTGEAEPQANVETQEPQAQAGPGEQPDESQHTAPLADGDEEGAQEAVDPELAEALKAYQDKVKKASDGRVDEDTMPPAPRGQTYEEASHDVAEEVPPGFVTAGQEADQQAREATDKVPTPASQGTREAQPQPATQPDASTSGVSPDRLAEELDAVVAKFEEEMDKAAQNK